MGNLDLAAFCVKHAAELNAGLGQSPTQQAIVQTFLKNYDKVRLKSSCLADNHWWLSRIYTDSAQSK